MSNEQ